MANEIVYFDSLETGAPTLNNAAGSAIAVLDACLITGFNTKSVTSITVSGGVATAVCTGHGYEGGVGRGIDIAGATPSGLNGRKKITVVNANTFTFPAPGVSDGAATGTITAKRSPLGWTKAYSDTNKAIYARTDVAASASLFRVDDTGAGIASATAAGIFGVESATGIDAYTSATSTTTLEKGANNTTAKRWVLIGDSRSFYLATEHVTYPWGSYPAMSAVAGFGDARSFRAGDLWRAFVLGGRHGLCPGYLSGANAGFSTQFRFMRSAGGLTQNVGGKVLGYEPNGSGGDGDARPFGYYDSASYANQQRHIPRWPSPVDGGLAVQYPVLVQERNDGMGHPIRGTMPGLAAPLAAVGAALNGQYPYGRVLAGVAGTGRDFLALSVLSGAGMYGAVLFDLTGPWQ